MKKGVQLYAIRALAQKDLEGALKVVSSIGYEGVEFAGFFEHDAKTVKGWLEKYNLVASSAHVGENLIFDTPEETIAYHKEIGNKKIICPGTNMKTREDALAFAEKCKKVAPLYKAAGMTLGYHNHAHEFEKDSGECLIDILANALPKEILELEFDVFWVYRGKENPVSYLNKYSDRISLFHAKDGNMEEGTTLGGGEVDLKGVFAFAKEHKLTWAVVESEASEVEDEQIKAITEDYTVLCELMK